MLKSLLAFYIRGPGDKALPCPLNPGLDIILTLLIIVSMEETSSSANGSDDLEPTTSVGDENCSTIALTIAPPVVEDVR